METIEQEKKKKKKSIRSASLDIFHWQIKHA